MDKFELNTTTPPPPAGKVNVVWQYDSAGNISGSVPSAGASQTPWLSDEDAATHNLNNLTRLDFTDVTGTKLDLWGNRYKIDVQNNELRMVYGPPGSTITFGHTTNGTDYLQKVSFDGSGGVHASTFYGSGAGLSANTIPITALTSGDYSSKITSGTYPISITGNAATAGVAGSANYVEWVNVGNKPGLIISGSPGSYPNAEGHWAIASTWEAANTGGAAFEIREVKYQQGSGPQDTAHSPRLAFVWKNVVASQIGINAPGWLCIWNGAGNAMQSLNCDWVYCSGISTGFGPNGVNTIHIRFQHPAVQTWRFAIAADVTPDSLDFLASNNNWASSVQLAEVKNNSFYFRANLFVMSPNLTEGGVGIGTGQTTGNFAQLSWRDSDKSLGLWHSSVGYWLRIKSDGMYIPLGLSTTVPAAGSQKLYRDAAGVVKIAF